MKITSFLKTGFAGIACVLLAQCNKTIPELKGEGDTSIAAYDYLQAPGGDTLPFIAKVNFTSKSTGEFLYQWDFGDNSALSSEKNPAHNYKIGGVYDVRLTTVGTNGNNSITKKIAVSDACGIDAFQQLTACGNAEWTWSSDGDAIRVLSPDATQVWFAGSAAGCQADDVYKFNRDGTFTYDAKGATFDVQSGYSCQAPKSNATTFKMVVKTGQRPKIFLGATSSGVGKPFIGTTDVADSNKYTIMSIADGVMVLRSTIENSGGTILEVKLKKLVALTINDIKNILTGNGTNRLWKLDPASGANPIIVGTEDNPAQYFGGGAIDGCQMDDSYRFTLDNKLTYNANGSTFNGGNVAPNYNCGADRSYSNITYTYGAVPGGLAGLAQITIPGAPPASFIGVTDVPSENVYRIIEISNTRMVLRAGNGSSTVFQFKMIAQ